jgi:putative SOS response-associated peptidase YedK
MCGRYGLSRRKEVLAEHFGAEFADMEWEPRWNVAPTQPVPVIRRDSKGPTLRASLMRWGLIPSWASDATIGGADDQRAIRDCREQAIVPGAPSETALSGPGGWVL